MKYSSEHLDQQYRTILSEASKFNEIQTVSKHDKNNRVTVGVSPVSTNRLMNDVVDKGSLSENLAVLVRDPAVIVIEEEITATFTSRMKGGDSWGASSTSDRCTLGFKVDFYGLSAMLTAGHCINDLSMSINDDVYHDGNKIGSWTGAWRYGSLSLDDLSGFDAALLIMNDFWTASDDILDDTYGSRDIVGSTSNYVSGYWRCFHGKNSGSVCREIQCTDINYLETSIGRYFNDVFSIDPIAIGGDSGSPVYRPRSGSIADVTGIAFAVTSLSCTNGSDLVIAKWDNIEDYWNLTLVTETEVLLPLIDN